MSMRNAPPVRRGVSVLDGSVAVAAGPDESEDLLIALGLDQAGVDRCREARVVELDREVLPAGIGGLLPGCADLGGAGEDPIVGGVVLLLLGRGEAGLGVDGQGADRAGVASLALGEVADGRHGVVSFRFVRPPHAALMVIPRAERRSTRTACGWSAAEDGR